MRVRLKNRGLELVLFGLLLIAFSCKKETETDHKEHTADTAEGVIYTCPMHPEVISDKPGRCPKCKMFLEPKDMVLEQLLADPNKVVVSSQATVQVSPNEMNKPIEVAGIIAFDERRNNTVSAYFPGLIEELFVKYNYTFVRKGQTILTLYSPELLTAQQEFLYVLNAGDTGLAEQARKRLRLLGLTEAQLRTLERTGKPQTNTTVFSPYEGFLRFDPALRATPSAASGTAAAAAGGMSGMGAANATPAPAATQPATSENNPLREGQYVTKGQTLFQVNDLKKVWAILTLPAAIAATVKMDDKVRLRSQLLPGNEIQGKVDFIEPFVREGQSQLTVRVYLDNPEQKLKPNALVQATIYPEGKSAVLTVPASAVWSLGRRHIVWGRKTIAGEHSWSFEATDVQIGKQNGDLIEITGGLPAGAHIAKEAGYMTDSESFIRP